MRSWQSAAWKRTWSYWHPELRSLPFRTVGKKCLLFASHPVLCHSSATKTGYCLEADASPVQGLPAVTPHLKISQKLEMANMHKMLGNWLSCFSGWGKSWWKSNVPFLRWENWLPEPWRLLAVTVFGVCEWDVAKNSDLGQGFEVLSSLSVTGSVTFLSPLLATVFLLGDLSSTPSNPNILGLFLTGLFGVS